MRALSGGVILIFLSTSAWAGPPFVTDDPEPVDENHWEINVAAMATDIHGETTASLPVIDANYGLLPGVQLHLQPQMAYDKTSAATHFGVGDTELGVKARFIEEGEGEDMTPMVSLYPLLELPTGNSRQGLGRGVTRGFLPIWVQKSIGDWTSFGGGGYWMNPGRDNRDAWFAGWALLNQVTPELQLGGEIFMQTADTVGGKNAPGFNVGGTYNFSESRHLLFSVGRGLANIDLTNRLSGYLALQIVY